MKSCRTDVIALLRTAERPSMQNSKFSSESETVIVEIAWSVKLRIRAGICSGDCGLSTSKVGRIRTAKAKTVQLQARPIANRVDKARFVAERGEKEVLEL